MTHSVLVGPGDEVPATLPVGGLVLRYDQVPWTQIVLEGVWDGTAVIPVGLATE